MNIKRVQVDGFGVWSGLSVEDVPDDMTVFFGRNEAGKTTLMQFMRTMLYGFSEERRERYLPPIHGGNGGGHLQLSSPRGTFDIERQVPRDESSVGKILIRGANGNSLGAHTLGNLLSGIDESIFNNVFAFGLREVQELGTLNDTEAAEQLYKLTSGLDRVSLVDVMRKLESERRELISDESGAGLIQQLDQRRGRLKRELEQARERSDRFVQVASQRSKLLSEIQYLEQQTGDLDQQQRLVEAALQVQEKWNARREVRAQLARLGNLPDLPPNAIDLLDAVNAEAEEQQRQIEQIKQRRMRVRGEAVAQPLNRQLWSNGARIEALNEYASWIASLEAQIDRLRGETTKLEIQLGAHRDQSGLAAEQNLPSEVDLSRRSFSMLREPARILREKTAELKKVKSDRDANRTDAERNTERLETALLERGHTSLAKALDEAGGLVSQLRRRVQLEQRIDKMLQSRTELQRESHGLLDDQVLPTNTVVLLGIPFVIGVALILCGLFWTFSASLGWPLAMLGFGGVALSVVMKVVMERSAAQELDDCNDQLDNLSRQIRKARDEREELDEQLPRGNGSLDKRLADAEAEVALLEELLPYDSNRQVASQRVDVADQRSDQLKADLQQAQLRWESALREVGLPSNMSPQQIKQLAQGSEQSGNLRRQLQSRRDELDAREGELLALSERVNQLVQDSELETAGTDPQTQLRQLSATYTQQQQLMERRRELRNQFRELRQEGLAHIRELRKLQQQKRVLLAKGATEDENEYRQLARRQAKHAQLTKRDQQLSEQITIALVGQCDEELVGAEIDANEQGLQERFDTISSRLAQSKSRLAQLHQQRGEYIAEMRSLSEDKRLDTAQMELECVERKLTQLTRRWRVLATTGLILESIRKVYETERQPETLSEASMYFKELTGGKYTRIWTPMTSNELRVDDEQGVSLPVEVLSRGTREAVFVALRLALVAAYARRGSALPLVLDDVMVNFDADRLHSALEVLRKFALAGHQLLLFTCHEHIMNACRSAKIQVRRLPKHADVAAGNVVLLPEPELEEESTEEPEPVEEPVADVDPVITLPETEEEEEVESEEEELEDDEELELEAEEEEELEEEDAVVAEDDDDDEALEEEDPIEVEWEDEYRLQGQPDPNDEYMVQEVPAEEPVSAAPAAPHYDHLLEPSRSTPPRAPKRATEELEALFDDLDDDPREPVEHGFTWQSPERWWDNNPDAA